MLNNLHIDTEFGFYAIKFKLYNYSIKHYGKKTLIFWNIY
jgi:hypothetical protein